MFSTKKEFQEYSNASARYGRNAYGGALTFERLKVVVITIEHILYSWDESVDNPTWENAYTNTYNYKKDVTIASLNKQTLNKCIGCYILEKSGFFPTKGEWYDYMNYRYKSS